MELSNYKLDILSAQTKDDAKYDVYIYHRPANKNEIIPGWERKTTTGNVLRARLKAKTLYDTDKYDKVEIKRRVFDSKTERTLASTFKVYQHKNYSRMFKVLLVFCMAALCALVSLSMVYYMPV